MRNKSRLLNILASGALLVGCGKSDSSSQSQPLATDEQIQQPQETIREATYSEAHKLALELERELESVIKVSPDFDPGGTYTDLISGRQLKVKDLDPAIQEMLKKPVYIKLWTEPAEDLAGLLSAVGRDTYPFYDFEGREIYGIHTGFQSPTPKGYLVNRYGDALAESDSLFHYSQVLAIIENTEQGIEIRTGYRDISEYHIEPFLRMKQFKFTEENLGEDEDMPHLYRVEKE